MDNSPLFIIVFVLILVAVFSSTGEADAATTSSGTVIMACDPSAPRPDWPSRVYA